MTFDWTTIPTTLDSLEGVPQDFAGFYQENKDGAGFALASLDALKNALQRVRLEKTEMKEKMQLAKDFSSLGESAEQIQLKLDTKEAQIDELLARRGAANDPAGESLQAELVEARGALAVEKLERKQELDKVMATLSSRDAAYQASLASRAATEAMAIEGGSIPLLRSHVEPFVKVVAEGGRYRSIVVDEAGEERRGEDGEPFTPRDLVKELSQVDELQPAFAGRGITGTGAQPGAPTGGGLGYKTMTRSQFDALPHHEKSAKMQDGWKLCD